MRAVYVPWLTLCLCLELQLCNPFTGKGLWRCLTWAAFGPGNLFMAGDDDWAKKKMIWSPQVSSWAFSLGRGVWGAILTCELSRFAADIEKMEVVPHDEALETLLLKTPTMCDSSEFSCDELTSFDRDNAAVGWAHLLTSNWSDQVGTES